MALVNPGDTLSKTRVFKDISYPPGEIAPLLVELDRILGYYAEQFLKLIKVVSRMSDKS